MNRRDRRRQGQTGGRRRAGKSPHVVVRDIVTGERYISVDDFVAYVRTHERPGITKIEVIRRMREVGWQFKYIEATNPKAPHETIGVDTFVAPDGWEDRWAA
jgi:hypothetical protein